MIDLDFGMNLKTKENFLIIRGDNHIIDWAKLLSNYLK